MQLFSRSADSVARIVLGLAALVVVGGPLYLMWWTRTPYVTGQFGRPAQPVPFDHRHHVVDDGIDCMYCHVDAARSPHAGVPPTDVCMNCHNQIWMRSPVLDRAPFANALAKVPLSIYAGLYRDETAEKCEWLVRRPLPGVVGRRTRAGRHRSRRSRAGGPVGGRSRNPNRDIREEHA